MLQEMKPRSSVSRIHAGGFVLAFAFLVIPLRAHATAVVTNSTTTTVAGTTTTTQAPSSLSLDLAAGWNLAGNGTDAALAVGALYSDTSLFVTVWKWVAAQSAWAFYAPSLAAQGGSVLADYANSKGYQVLTTVAPGEGYWVNAKLAANVALPSGNAISIAALGSTLVSGWNLVALGQAATPKQFCDAQSSGVTTLWAWDALNSAWYFYAPSLDNSGGLLAYINGKGYRDFTAAGKTLNQGTGFWVNRQ